MKTNQRQQQQQAAHERERVAEDIRMMQDPRRWPRFGVLPVVSRRGVQAGEFPRCGFLRVWDIVEPVVYVGNLYALSDLAEERRKKGEGGGVKLSELEQVRYIDFEALAAEWRVD